MALGSNHSSRVSASPAASFWSHAETGPPTNEWVDEEVDLRLWSILWFVDFEVALGQVVVLERKQKVLGPVWGSCFACQWE